MRARASRRLQPSRSRARRPQQPPADLDIYLAAARTAFSGFFSCVPSARFMSSVRKTVHVPMAVDCAVDMAALPGYAEPLRACSHKVAKPRSRTCFRLFRSPLRRDHSPIFVITPSQSVHHQRCHTARDPDQGGEARSRAEEEERHAVMLHRFQCD